MKNKGLILGLLLAAGGAVYLYKTSKAAPDQEPVAPADPVAPVIPAPPAPVSSGPVVLDRNRVLARGSKGAEVSELQGRLNVKVDGDFGPGTEMALIKRKGRKAISLNQFDQLPNVNVSALKIGDSVVADRGVVVTFRVTTGPNASYLKTQDVSSEYEYNDSIGKIIAVTPDKLSYVVMTNSDVPSWLVWASAVPKFEWVSAADVRKKQ